MPRRSILSASERDSLLAIPGAKDELIRHYTFNESDLAIIRQHRGATNRLGFAIQLCYLRFPGVVLGLDELPFPPLLQMVASQLKVPVEIWNDYGRREQTRRDHLVELQAVFGFQLFTTSHYRHAVQMLTELALRTNKGIVLAGALIEDLRRQAIIMPAINTIERACAEAITRADRRIYALLTDSLLPLHCQQLDALLQRKGDSKITGLAWLRQSPSKPNSRQMLEHIERLKALQAIDLPAGIERSVHQNRLLKIAREGNHMTPADLAKFEPQRRYATLTAMMLETRATLIDEIIDLHHRIIGKMFNAAKHKHQQQFQDAGKAINDKVRLYGRIGQVLLEAKQTGDDPFVAIESVIPWERFEASISEAQKLAQPEAFDFLHRIGESYATLRRYAPEFIPVLVFRATPAARHLLDAMEVLRNMNAGEVRKVPADAPTQFIRNRWEKLVMTNDGLDRRCYELCALAELKNALRSGDIWVEGSRQFKDFDEYLLPGEKFAALKRANEVPLAVASDCDQYLSGRLTHLKTQLATVDAMASRNILPDASITDSGLKMTPLDAAVPDSAQTLIDQSSLLLPHIKITELLIEVDAWSGFTNHFTHLKTGDVAKDKALLMTAILADAINLRLTKMAESCPGTTYARLSWLQAWHIRDETYSSALAELVNTQFRHPFAENWGAGSTSSSDGQRFRAGSKTESTGHINPKYGGEPGRMFYTHISCKRRL